MSLTVACCICVSASDNGVLFCSAPAKALEYASNVTLALGPQIWKVRTPLAARAISVL
jgi:hypothetical protein